MKDVEGQIVSLPPAARTKMDDRKRSLAVDPDDAYPSKRHASASNGTHIRMSDPDKEKDIEVRMHAPTHPLTTITCSTTCLPPMT